MTVFIEWMLSFPVRGVAAGASDKKEEERAEKEGCIEEALEKED